MRYLISLAILLSTTLSAYSQHSSAERSYIEGVVIDEASDEAIHSATVKLLNRADSALVRGTATDEKGKFRLDTNHGKYIVEVSFIGYQKNTIDIELTKDKPTLRLDTIYLKDDAIALQQAEVVADIPAMQVKGDTIEFNPRAYSVDGSTVLKDLIKQIPGLEITSEGVLKANGKAISKILVDGKEYFGNDISMALTNLPATMITKLQLFEKESEEAKASGIKDDNPEQVLNLGVKEEFKRSTFGDAKTGMGSKNRHTNRFNVQKMYGDNQYALVGNLNNINDSDYGYSRGLDDNITKSLGTNFNIQESEKITINGSAQYSNDKSRNEYINDAYSSVLDQYTNSSGQSVNRRQDMRTNFSIDWKLDTLTTIFIRTDLSYNTGENISTSRDSAHIVDKSTTSSASSRFSENNSFGINNSVMISRKLNNEGRNVTLNLNQGYTKNNSDGTNYSEKIYWEQGIEDIIDQKNKNDGESVNYGMTARYVEPLGKEDRVYVSYSIRLSENIRDNDVRRIDPETGEYSLVDAEYSRSTNSYSLRQNIRMGWQQTKEKYNFNLGFSVDPTYTLNETYLVNAIPEKLKQNVVNFSPSARMSWKLKKDTHLDFGYYGSTNHPSPTELSKVPIIHSAMSQTVGNPDLKPSFDNNFNVDFRKSDFESGRYFSASVNYSYTFNSTVAYQVVDEHSNTTNTYRNVDGNSRAYAYVNYNTPLPNKKIEVGGYLNTSYNKNIAYLNDKKKTIDRVSLGPSVYGRFNAEKIEVNLNFMVNHSISNNNLADKKQSNTTDYRLSNTLKVRLPMDFSIESTLNFSHRQGLAEGIRKNETMWNLAASKLFLKDKRGTLKFEFFDVLNDLRTQENTVNGSDYSNSWQKMINNYFIFSFAYRFEITGKKKN